MADLFISYSRRDKPLVERLHAGLEAAGKDAWTDWDDIAPTADWMASIYQAIEEADSFVYVISPDSVNSEVCCRAYARGATYAAYGDTKRPGSGCCPLDEIPNSYFVGGASGGDERLMGGSALSAGEVAKLLGVPVFWVYEQSRRGASPP